MYLQPVRGGYTRDAQQRSGPGPFLILVSRDLQLQLTPCRRCHGSGVVSTRCLCGDPKDACILFGTCKYEDLTWWLAVDGGGWGTREALMASTTTTCTYCGGDGHERHYTHDKRIRALVRSVSMRQFGHFMMGAVTVNGHRIGLSGTYGGDGLSCTVPDAVFDLAVPLPDELREAWNKGGGHNSAGSEAPAMRAWALANLARLRAPRAPRSRKATTAAAVAVSVQAG